jgi:GNAT superfamily N-acetyltransferase
MIECCKMTVERLPEAFSLLNEFLTQDEYYLNSSKIYGDGGSIALKKALELFLSCPEIGFVWMAYEGQKPVAICVVCFAISTSIGAMVAKLDDVFVATEHQNQGIGSILISQLKRELQQLGIRRIDTGVHLQNHEARRFYTKHNFFPLNEERLSCLL